MIFSHQNTLQSVLSEGIGISCGQAAIDRAQPDIGIADTGSELAKEWANPSVVIATVLMLVGGGVIREALAQSTGNIFTPVCFSFGWVSYMFSSLKDAFGEGRLLPQPDYPVKVFNLGSGYYRINKNWIIGRIVRDHESWISKFAPLNDNGIRIAIFEAKAVPPRKNLYFRYNTRHLLGFIVMFLQLVLAAIPTILTRGREWGILAITVLGTLLAMGMGALPQWWVEKVPKCIDSKKMFALTAGNGSRDVMVIKGEGRCLDLEELATLESPRTGTPWTKMEKFSLPRKNSWGRQAKTTLGIPVGFLITRCVCVFEALIWFFLLISVGGIRSHTWFLIAIGTVGLAYNNMLADLKREPKTRNLPLKLLDTISTRKIMDGLMDLEETHKGCGEALLQEFFPGRLRIDEEEWWRAPKGSRSATAYDRKRSNEHIQRLRPRSMLPPYNLHAVSDSPTLRTDPESSDIEASTNQAFRSNAPNASQEPPIIAPRETQTRLSEQRHFQPQFGSIEEQLQSRRTPERVGQPPPLTRAGESALSSTSGDGLLESRRDAGSPANDDASENPSSRRPLIRESNSTEREKAKILQKRPYWD